METQTNLLPAAWMLPIKGGMMPLNMALRWYLVPWNGAKVYIVFYTRHWMCVTEPNSPYQAASWTGTEASVIDLDDGSKTGEFIVWINTSAHDSFVEIMVTLAHELLHLIDDMRPYVCSHLDKSDEWSAYTVSYLLRCIGNIVSKGHPCSRAEFISFIEEEASNWGATVISGWNDDDWRHLFDLDVSK